jgi:hypothetical protein
MENDFLSVLSGRGNLKRNNQDGKSTGKKPKRPAELSHI